jgi:hypothetical protein
LGACDELVNSGDVVAACTGRNKGKGAHSPILP